MKNRSRFFLLSLMSTAVCAAMIHPVLALEGQGDGLRSDSSIVNETQSSFDILTPMEGERFIQGTPMYVSLRADSAYDSATLQINGEVVTTLPAGQLEYFFTPEVEVGPFTLTVAFNIGEEEEVVVRNLVMTAEDHQIVDPVVQASPVLSPQEGQHFAYGDEVKVKVAVPPGEKREISLVVDGQLKGTVSEPPYEIFWTPESLGYLTLDVQEHDPKTGFDSFTKIDIYVASGNEGKEVIITSGLPKLVDVLAGQPQQLSVDVTEGQVEFVRFFINEIPVHTFTKPPYILTWTPPAMGNYLFTVEAAPVGQADITLPGSTEIGAVHPETLAFCRQIAPDWQEGISYPYPSFVEFEGNFYRAIRETTVKPNFNVDAETTGWQVLTCLSLLDYTAPTAYMNTPPGAYKTGELVTLEIVVNPPEIPGVSIEKVELFRGQKKLETLTAPYSYTYSFPAGKEDDLITFLVTNNWGISTTGTTKIFRSKGTPE